MFVRLMDLWTTLIENEIKAEWKFLRPEAARHMIFGGDITIGNQIHSYRLN